MKLKGDPLFSKNQLTRGLLPGPYPSVKAGAVGEEIKSSFIWSLPPPPRKAQVEVTPAKSLPFEGGPIYRPEVATSPLRGDNVHRSDEAGLEDGPPLELLEFGEEEVVATRITPPLYNSPQ